MDKFRYLHTAFGTKGFVVAILFLLFVLLGNFETVNGQQPRLALKLLKVRVFNNMDKNGVVTSEKYNEKGGVVEINVRGDAFSLCPGGAEKMRFTWSFDRNASQLFGGGGISASLEAGQVTNSQPCTIGLAARSDFWILPSSGNVTPFSSEERKGIDGDAFYQPSEKRGRVWAYPSDKTTGVFGVELVDRPLFTNTRFAWFEVLIGTPAGGLRYVYLYEKDGGNSSVGENNSSLVGDWTGTSGSGGLREEWYIRNDNGQWTVTGSWFRGNKEVGSFSGENYRYQNGRLSFTQILNKAPIEGWTSGTQLEVWAEGEIMTFKWTTANGSSGTVTQRRKTK